MSGGLPGRARKIQGPGGGQTTPNTLQNIRKTYKKPFLKDPWPGKSPDTLLWRIEQRRKCHKMTGTGIDTYGKSNLVQDGKMEVAAWNQSALQMRAPPCSASAGFSKAFYRP